jgi:hypothetical protein
MTQLEGVLHLQYFYDIGGEIDLKSLRGLLGLPETAPKPSFRQPAPDYVRFEEPPVEELLPSVVLESGEAISARMRYFQYGVARLQLDIPFRGSWQDLVILSSQSAWSDRLDRDADKTLRNCSVRASAAIRRPVEIPIREDYAVIELRGVPDPQGAPMPAPELIARHGSEIVQIVRGETIPLSAAEQADVLCSSLSYSPGDLLVVGYAVALVYDQQPEGARPLLELLEYANTQLLEYRVYDELLAPVLADVYRRSAVRTGAWSHWRSSREAGKLNALRLEVMELTERADSAIKFLSDMYYARAYKMASARIGVPDYRRLVEAKLAVAGELYRFMMDRSHQASAFVLELTIVIILIIDLIVLFGGKPQL